MTNRVYVIQEKRTADNIPFYWQWFESQSEARDPITQGKWFNLNSDGYLPNGVGTEEHHGPDGTSCDDAGMCICGSFSMNFPDTLTWEFHVKVPTDETLPFFPEEEELYKERLAYCKKYKIEISTFWKNADDMWKIVD
jgi:hypothetical protein